MPFDALFLTAVRRELESSLTGCRVDKVQQPQRDTLILSMRRGRRRKTAAHGLAQSSAHPPDE